jgi:hypothetical protein
VVGAGVDGEGGAGMEMRIGAVAVGVELRFVVAVVRVCELVRFLKVLADGVLEITGIVLSMQFRPAILAEGTHASSTYL